jgi:UDP-N-acetylglucosamine acyltransferase
VADHRFCSHGGGIHHLAYVGGNPEHRDWKPGDPALQPVIDATARIEAFVTVDSGIHEPTRIGPRSWCMKRVHVGHDAQIGADCELTPGVTIGGHVVLGDGVRIGINACVRPGVKVGDGARIGCGAVVITDIPAGEVWVGNPAHKLANVAEVSDAPGMSTIAAA